MNTSFSRLLAMAGVALSVQASSAHGDPLTKAHFNDTSVQGQARGVYRHVDSGTGAAAQERGVASIDRTKNGMINC